MKKIILLSLLSCLLFAEGKEDVGLNITLIAENETITPGKPFTVGLHIQHEAGYHTYWKNPGIVGLPTGLEWSLPPGFTASELSWPYPELSDMAGHPCHGYERDVTLLTTITPPQKIDAKEITLKATGSWMCCAEGCYPGSKKFSLSLSVAEKSKPHRIHAKLIAKAQKEIPKAHKNWTATLLSESGNSPIRLSLTSSSDDLPEYFFSSSGQISSNKKQTFLQKSEGSWILSVPKSEFSPANPSTFEGVLKTKSGHHLISIKLHE